MTPLWHPCTQGFRKHDEDRLHEKKAWKFAPTATAKQLIAALLSNDLIEPYWQEEFNNLSNVLESGTPTVRNKNSGHGQGAVQREIPQYLAAYALQTAAANINLLAAAYEAHK